MRHQVARFNPCPDREVKRDTISGVHEKPVEIRWRDLDAYRHVNNAVYATYLEECRDELAEAALEGVGDPWDFVLARVAIDYRRELTQEDEAVVVRCTVERIGNSSIILHEEIRTRGGELAAEAEAVLVARDPATGRSRPLTEAERAGFERAGGRA
jgi:acyl-CoA thioester hydrolase